MGRAFVLLGLAAVSILVAGCASKEQEDDPNRVSTIPWNRPESWESQGPLGGMMPGGGTR
jgi:hypothetical protein